MHREIHLQMNFSEQAVLTESLQTQILVVLLQLHVFLPLSSTLGYVTHVSLCGYDRLSPGGPLQLCHQSHFMDFSLCYSTLGKRVQDVNWRQHSCMNLLTGELPPFVRTVHFDTWPLGIAMCFSFKKFGCSLEYSSA